jgi:pyruvate dehydrogenase E2 component (dihydrolipoyllysine-residue acetyltransferase)
MTELTMPRLSDSMEQGTILTWLKRDGDEVVAGEDLVEIETDKATMTHTAEAGGILTLLVGEGETLPVGTPIARVGAGHSAPPEPAAPAPPTALSPEPAASAPPTAVSPEPAADAAPTPVADAATPVAPSAATNGKPADGDVRASPLARRIAREHAIVLEAVAGSGPRGRITRADVLAAAGIAASPPAMRATAPAPPAPAPAPAAGAVEHERLSRLQQVVARRMVEAKSTVPEFQVQTEVRMDAAIALRAQLKAAAGDQPVPSFNDLIVKAAALALREHPRANGSYQGDTFALHADVNVGVAVAAADALVVVTVREADRKSIGQIARDVRALAERVRAGTITPPELEGATFTVSNLGMYGMTAITPVINVPQAAILGVGALRETLARQDDEIIDRTLLTLTLTCDHRILYGADAARFLARIRELLESPLALVL